MYHALSFTAPTTLFSYTRSIGWPTLAHILELSSTLPMAPPLSLSLTLKIANEKCQSVLFECVLTYDLGKSHAPSLVYRKTLNPINLLRIYSLTSLWTSHTISTLEYLCKLNLFSSRTFHDFSRHPILPTVLANYTSPRLTVIQCEPRIHKSLFSGRSLSWQKKVHFGTFQYQ